MSPTVPALTGMNSYLGGWSAFKMPAMIGDGPIAFQTLERAWRHAAGLKFKRHGSVADWANGPMS